MVSLALLHLASCGSAKDQTQGFRCVKDTLPCPLPREGAAARDSALPTRQSPLLDQIYPCLDLNESLSAGTCRLCWLYLCIRAEGSCSYLLRFATAFRPSRAVEDGQPVLCGCIVGDAAKDSALAASAEMNANSAGPESSETCDGI